jgi:sigma-B regulation protein RsbU (phosphoserine phosphatase)
VSSDAITREVVISALRANLPFFGSACIILLAGVCALLLARLRSRDRLLLWVGIFSVLYGARLFLENELVRVAFNAHGHGYVPWTLCITYVINIPYALFARELLGRGWKGAIGLWLWLTVGFAVIAIPAAFFAYSARWTDLANSVLVVSGTLLILLHVLARGRRAENSLAASLLWPLLVFSILVVLENKGVRPGGINMEPVGFLILLAGLASVATRRALATERKLIDVEQELATARRIQNSIIPPVPRGVRSVRLATRYQPMTSVAGDFYDFLDTGNGLLTILVADVSGHGVPAALVASMLKVSFAAQRERANNPAGILAGLSTMLQKSLGGQYVTAACASIDTQARVITYAGAGHPPSLFLRRHTGEIVHLAENGLLIGPFPTATYTNISLPFHSGDKLLLYTDGIVEASGPDGQEFGRDRLESFLLKGADQDPEEFLDSLFQRISAVAQQDDLTAVLAQFD